MKVKVPTALKRLVESAADTTTGSSVVAHARRRGKDFMAFDLTGSARRYAR